MENKQQTAVEWFFDTLVEQRYFKKLPIEQYHKAKAMENKYRDAFREFIEWIDPEFAGIKAKAEEILSRVDSTYTAHPSSPSQSLSQSSSACQSQ
jgi:hypothetical protein